MQFINKKTYITRGILHLLTFAMCPRGKKNIYSDINHLHFDLVVEIDVSTFCLRSTGRRCRAASNKFVIGADRGAEIRILRTDNGEPITNIKGKCKWCILYETSNSEFH